MLKKPPKSGYCRKGMAGPFLLLHEIWYVFVIFSHILCFGVPANLQTACLHPETNRVKDIPTKRYPFPNIYNCKLLVLKAPPQSDRIDISA